MIKNSPVVPAFTQLKPSSCLSFLPTCLRIEKYFGARDKWPQVLRDLHDGEKELAIQSFGMALAFLEEALIADRTIPTGSYLRYEPEGSVGQPDHMILDS